LSAEIVERRFRGRLSRAWFFTGPVGLLILLRHVCTPRRSVWKAGPLKECKCGHSGGGATPDSTPGSGRVRWPRLGVERIRHVGAIYGESVAGSPPPECAKRV